MKRVSCFLLALVVVMALTVGCGRTSTPVPTEAPPPTEAPIPVPTEVPTKVPTEVPTKAPTEVPVAAPPVEKIVIGYPASLTGKFEQLGKAGLNGLQLFAEWVNEQGGIEVKEWGVKLPVEIVFADDKSEKETAVRLLEKFIKQDKAQFVMASYSSGLTLAQAPIAETSRVIMLGWAAASDKIWAQGFKYVVGVITPSSLYDASLLELMTTLEPRPETIAVIYKDNPFTTSIAEGTIERAKELGFEVVFTDKYPEDATDLSPILLKAQAANPDVLLVEAHFQDGALAAKQVAEVQFDARLIAYGSASATTKWAEQLGKVAEYTVGVSQWEPNMPIDPQAFDDPNWYGPRMSPREWADWFKGKYGYEPDFRAMQMFASALTLKAAIEDAGSLDTEKVRQSLLNLELVTTYGKYKVDPETFKQIAHEMVAIQWKEGKKVVIAPPAFKTDDVIYPVPAWSER